ncbi:MAG: hypothetical protein QXX03_05530 [Nitrososphaerota archaeon]
MKINDEIIKEIVSELTALSLSYVIYKYFRREFIDDDFIEIKIFDILKSRNIKPETELIKEIKNKFYKQFEYYEKLQDNVMKKEVKSEG